MGWALRKLAVSFTSFGHDRLHFLGYHHFRKTSIFMYKYIYVYIYIYIGYYIRIYIYI